VPQRSFQKSSVIEICQYIKIGPAKYQSTARYLIKKFDWKVQSGSANPKSSDPIKLIAQHAPIKTTQPALPQVQLVQPL
jgi:hypothetical protein